MSISDATHATDIHSLYSNHHGWLHGWLRKRMSCSETAADLAQDTFMRLLQRDGDDTVIRQPRAFLTRIAQGLMINHWRRQEIERAYLEALAAQPAPLAPSAEENHLIIESLLEVDALLRKLPDKVRQAFLLSRLEGLTYARIGEELGVSERTVKHYMAQAMHHCLLLDAER